jgi:hypothetical protein
MTKNNPVGPDGRCNDPRPAVKIKTLSLEEQPMTTVTQNSVLERATAMQEYIKTGRILDAMTEFYAPDSAMQENANPPTVGLAVNIEREKQFLAGVKQWIGYNVKAIAAAGDTAFVESSIDFIATSGAKVHMEQVSITKWKNGKIAHERFYYDSAGKK